MSIYLLDADILSVDLRKKSILESFTSDERNKISDLVNNGIYYRDGLPRLDLEYIQSFKDNNFKEIKQGDAGYMELLKRWKNSLSDYQIENAKESYGKRIYLPTLVSVVKGQVSQVETGEVEELTDPRGKMSKEIFDKIYNKFK